MGVTLTFTGLTELRNALRVLPETLTDDAEAIVRAHADLAEAQVIQRYPVGPTGHLRGRVYVSQAGTGTSTTATLRSAAPHAHLYERGTKTRRTRRGANRGRMPRASRETAFVPAVIPIRARMVRALIDLVRQAGFTVGGV